MAVKEGQSATKVENVCLKGLQFYNGGRGELKRQQQQFNALKTQKSRELVTHARQKNTNP